MTSVRCMDYIRVFGFFVQAEDGIRDLVRSRGLGDVYKRQDDGSDLFDADEDTPPAASAFTRQLKGQDWQDPEAVSYTHLTLPTSDLV